MKAFIASLCDEKLVHLVFNQKPIVGSLVDFVIKDRFEEGFAKKYLAQYYQGS